MTFDEASTLALGRRGVAPDPTFARLRGVLQGLGLPQDKLKLVHVAGTNGKTAVSCLLDSVLRAAGYKCGLFTSAHHGGVLEHIRLDDESLSEEEFVRHVGSATALEGESKLAYRELLTAVALAHFAEKGAEVVVFENGPGGGKDPVNAVEAPILTVLTSAGADPRQGLGATAEQAGLELAECLKPGAPCVCGVTQDEALGVINAAAYDRLIVVEPVTEPLPIQPVRTDWADGMQLVRLDGAGELFFGLLGAHQLRNAAVVLKAVETLRPSFPKLGPEAVEVGFRQVRVPGRFEARSFDADGAGRTLLLDPAGNEEAARAFFETIRASPYMNATMIVGFVGGQDVHAILQKLGPIIGRVVVARPSDPDGMAPEEAARKVKEAAPNAQVTVCPDAEAALEAWLTDRLPGARTGLALGSFEWIVDCLRWADRRAPPK